MNQKKYWDSMADEKEFTAPLDVKRFKKYVKKNALILDLGCGYGRTLHQLKQIGYNNLTGIDFSEKMILRGHRLFPEIKMEVMHDDYKLPNDYFDAVILFAVLTCIENNDEQKNLIANIFNTLNKNGIIYISDFLLNNDPRNLERYNKYQAKYTNYGTFELENGAILRHHAKKWLNELLKDFKTIEYGETQFKTMNRNTSNAFLYFGKKE